MSATASYASGDCGSTDIAMVLNFKGTPCTVDDVSRATGYPAGFTSLSAADMVTVAAKFGLPLKHNVSQTIDSVKKSIDGGNPVIILVNYAALPSTNKYDPNYTRGHWILAVGYSDAGIIYSDPYWPNASGGAFRELTYTQFDAAWATTNSDFSTPRQDITVMTVTPTPVAKIGLHMAARGGDQTPADWQAFDTAKLQAVKFLSNHSMSDIQAGIQRVGASNVYFRMFASPSDLVMASGTSFFNVHKGWFDQLYPMGVVKYEIGNEPNIPEESNNWTWWADAAGFANWYRDCAKLIRLNYPKAQIVWPGLSPQPNVPDWIAQLKILISENLVDMIGCHAYFQNGGTGLYGIDNVDSGGLYYTRFLGLGKPVVITESSNNSISVSPTEKGTEYVYYSHHIRQGVESVLFFVSSTANPTFNSEAWAGTQIPSIVGSR